MAIRNILLAATLAAFASTAAFASDVPPSDATANTESAAVPAHKAAHKAHKKGTHKKTHTKKTTSTTSTDTSTDAAVK